MIKCKNCKHLSVYKDTCYIPDYVFIDNEATEERLKDVSYERALRSMKKNGERRRVTGYGNEISENITAFPEVCNFDLQCPYFRTKGFYSKELWEVNLFFWLLVSVMFIACVLKVVYLLCGV